MIDRPILRGPTLHELTVDLAGVTLHRDDRGTYVAPRRDAAGAPGDEPIRVYLDPDGSRYPIFILGDLGAEFALDEAVELAYALLALVREGDRLDAVARRAHRDRDPRRRTDAEDEESHKEERP